MVKKECNSETPGSFLCQGERLFVDSSHSDTVARWKIREARDFKMAWKKCAQEEEAPE